jgi:hypothetical protein
MRRSLSLGDRSYKSEPRWLVASEVSDLEKVLVLDWTQGLFSLAE